MNKINFNLNQLAHGEVAERINQEILTIAENILDMNTDAEKERKLIIEVGYTPNVNRDTLSTTVQVKSKLVPQQKTVTTMLIGQDYVSGDIAVNELQSNTPGQMFFDPDDNQLKTDIGQPVEEIEDDVVDYNERKKGDK